MCPGIILCTKCAGSLKTRGDLDVAPSKVSFRSSHVGWSWLIRRSRTHLHHRVEQLPDTQTTPATTYLHFVRVSGEFFSSFLPRKMIIVSIRRIIPPPQRLEQFLIISRDAFSPQKGPMIGSDRGSVVCNGLRFFELFRQNDVSHKKGRTRAPHHCPRPYFYKQDIDVSSRGGCVISVLSCLCAHQNRPKIMVATPSGLNNSTCWDPRDLLISDSSISYLSGYQKSASRCSRRTDRPDSTRGFLTANFKYSIQNYVDKRCCSVRNQGSGSVRLGESSVVYDLCILNLGFSC